MMIRHKWLFFPVEAVALLLCGLAGIRYVISRPQKLKATLTVKKADLGIPGITKVYNANLTNDGRWPVRITRCSFMDDAGTHDTSIAYAIQRWDNGAGKWQEVLGSSRKSFCHPYPLGIAEADLNRSWLWSGQSLEIGEEATAARDGFQIGDKARFVLFTAEPGDYSSSIPTEAFTIDEAPTSDVDFRVRH
jgi:hypothetical protein